MNVFHPKIYSTRYYLLHPWKWIKQFFSNLHAAWMRATKGYCYSDIWNLSDWFCEIIPPMLRHLADNGAGHPADTSPEQWHEWLYEMAQSIENIQCDTWFDDNNEYAEDYNRSLENELYNLEQSGGLQITFSNNPPYEEIRKLYYTRARELSEIRQQAIDDVFKQLGQRFDSLWD